MVKKSALALGLFALGYAPGCGQSEQKSAVIIDPSSVVSNGDRESPEATPPLAALTRAPAPRLKLTVPVFEYPADLGGKTVAEAVQPSLPELESSERLGAEPIARRVPAKYLNPEPIVRPTVTIAASFPNYSRDLTIAPPRETIPFDFGRGADSLLPARPTLPVAAAITERARDAAIPPPLPILGRRLSERVSVEDPTSELAHAAIVSPAVNVPLASAAFLKVSLPDPFELGEQVKPTVPPALQPALTPVTVNPQRNK